MRNTSNPSPMIAEPAGSPPPEIDDDSPPWLLLIPVSALAWIVIIYAAISVLT